MRLRLAFPATAAVIVTAAACNPGPLPSPRTGVPSSAPIALDREAPTGSVEAVRRQLAGTWDLVALSASPETGGPLAEITAKGTLVYDEFGNLTIDARTTDPDAPVAAREVPRVSFKGRAVIDAPHSELQLMALTGNVDPNEVLTPDRRRKYEFVGEELKLTTFDAKGQVTAISSWKRRVEPK
jgi:hypothetical protein